MSYIFSEVHGAMNCSGSLTKFTLHVTHCGSKLHEPQKNEIHYLMEFIKLADGSFDKSHMK